MRINVMVSQAEPFVFIDNATQKLNGLDVKIIENFAKRVNLQVNYIITNESLNEVFSTEKSLMHFLKLIKNL